MTVISSCKSAVSKLGHSFKRMKMAGTQMSVCVRQKNLQVEFATRSSEASCIQPGFYELPCLSNQNAGLQSHQSNVVENQTTKFQVQGTVNKQPGVASVEPSMESRCGEDMDSWAMGALAVKILPTCDEYDVLSPKSQEHVPKVEELNWEALPDDIKGCVLRKVDYEDLSKVKIISKSMKTFIQCSGFLSSRGASVSKEGSLTSLCFYIKHGGLQWSGFDLLLKKWRPLPTLWCLPPPDQNLFKEYLVCAGNGLLCANVSKSLKNEKLVVCNPMTQISRVLPPLNFPRNPVLMHMVTNATSYKVIVVGSSGIMGGNTLSRKTEVYDSCTSKWEVKGDMPGLEFSLNEYQTGVCVNGILYCIAFLEDMSGKGVLAYDVDKGKWLLDWKCPLPGPENISSSSVSQLVECDSEVYLFQERETGRTVEHRIDKLENDTLQGGSGRWKNIVREQKTGGRGLLVYPEYVCVTFGDGKVCVFNSLEHTGKVYDIRDGSHLGPLPLKLNHTGSNAFHSLNPLSFTFEPNFKSTV